MSDSIDATGDRTEDVREDVDTDRTGPDHTDDDATEEGAYADGDPLDGTAPVANLE